LRAQRLLRLTRSGASGLKSGERDGSYRDRDRKWPLIDTLSTEWGTNRVRVNALPTIPFGLSTFAERLSEIDGVTSVNAGDGNVSSD
jgi:hypothetical protein